MIGVSVRDEDRFVARAAFARGIDERRRRVRESSGPGSIAIQAPWPPSTM